MDDQRIKFPDRMKVESPEIDSISKSTKTIANIFHKDFREVVRALQSLTKLPDLISNLQKTVVGQFTSLFTQMVESDVMHRKANLKVLQKKISFVAAHIKKKEEHVNETISGIESRYENMSEQVSAEHESYLGKLDSHALEIVDSIYPKQVQERFSYESMPNIQYLTDHAQGSAYARSFSLDFQFEKAKKAIEAFEEERSSSYAQLHDLSHDKIESGDYALPFYFVESFDEESGEKGVEVFFEWDVEGLAPASDEQMEELKEMAKIKVMDLNGEHQDDALKAELLNKAESDTAEENEPADKEAFNSSLKAYMEELI